MRSSTRAPMATTSLATPSDCPLICTEICLRSKSMFYTFCVIALNFISTSATCKSRSPRFFGAWAPQTSRAASRHLVTVGSPPRRPGLAALLRLNLRKPCQEVAEHVIIDSAFATTSTASCASTACKRSVHSFAVPSNFALRLQEALRVMQALPPTPAPSGLGGSAELADTPADALEGLAPDGPLPPATLPQWRRATQAALQDGVRGRPPCTRTRSPTTSALSESRSMLHLERLRPPAATPHCRPRPARRCAPMSLPLLMHSLARRAPHPSSPNSSESARCRLPARPRGAPRPSGKRRGRREVSSQAARLTRPSMLVGTGAAYSSRRAHDGDERKVPEEHVHHATSAALDHPTLPLPSAAPSGGKVGKSGLSPEGQISMTLRSPELRAAMRSLAARACDEGRGT